MKAKINWQGMLPKSSVQGKFIVDKNKIWRSYLWDHLKLQLLSIVIMVVFWGLFYVPRNSMDRLLTGIGFLIGICFGFIVWLVSCWKEANQAAESYYFEINDSFIMVIAKNLNFITPMPAVYKVSVEHQFITESYRMKIQSRFCKKPLYIMGFDEKTAHALKDYIAAKMPNLES